ncbi:MAG: hypothetical protein RID09_21620 [Coleofasciculus sp. G1-WW12-02]|uniref:hypothetical protein n=1 Tax=Coleofasciculus sp. G1-WW12-02 TaxID=3068483 RepID=UPI0032F0EFAF
MIAIYPNSESAQKAAEFYPDWMGLFCYYTKINWAYAQSRLIKKNIFDYYKKIERDRSFQEFVAIVGAGVAGASFAPADKNCQPIFSRTAVICKIPVLFSLLVFVIVAGLTWLIRRQWKRSP